MQRSVDYGSGVPATTAAADATALPGAGAAALGGHL